MFDVTTRGLNFGVGTQNLIPLVLPQVRIHLVCVRENHWSLKKKFGSNDRVHSSWTSSGFSVNVLYR